MAKGAFVKGKIWRYLKANPNSRLRDIAAYAGTTKHSATNLLRRLRATGHAELVGKTHKARWRAVGNRPPTDDRGLSAGSMKALKVNWPRWRQLLVQAYTAIGDDRRLETFSARYIAKDCRQSARESAPARIAIPTLGDLARQIAPG